MLLKKEEIYGKVGFSALTVDHDHSCMYESMIGQLSVTISPLGKRIEAGRTNYVTCSCLTVVQRGWKKPLAWYERKIQQSGQHSKNIQLINNWKGRFWVQLLGQWSLDHHVWIMGEINSGSMLLFRRVSKARGLFRVPLSRPCHLAFTHLAFIFANLIMCKRAGIGMSWNWVCIEQT